MPVPPGLYFEMDGVELVEVWRLMMGQDWTDREAAASFCRTSSWLVSRLCSWINVMSVWYDSALERKEGSLVDICDVGIPFIFCSIIRNVFGGFGRGMSGPNELS